ncbi:MULTISPECIES: GntR family transcriptional regulator [Bacillus]|uniref:GntR family transcriptional regulator n=1 Tax=Bacillus TaxID=1386 RepID=UPI0002D4E608|nr:MULTISPECIES: GntR family transcriptional regulator [Bacillus]
MILEMNTREPIYIQVVTFFKQRIAIGELKAGEEIPSRRELAVELNINPNTVQKAYKEMEDQRLIITERNFPSHITEDEEVLKQVRKELITDATEHYVAAMKKISIPVEEIIDTVKEIYQRGEVK